MKASEQFKAVMGKYLSETAQSDKGFAPHFAKESKNLESCIHYIFGEVKKTGLCAFDNQEIFDMAVKYYTDDSIGTPTPIACRAVVQQTVKADLFSQPQIPLPSAKTEPMPQAKQEVKPVQTTLTLFDL